VVEHTVKAYDKELDTLGRRIAEMGGIAEKMVIDATDALAAADTVLAHQVVRFRSQFSRPEFQAIGLVQNHRGKSRRSRPFRAAGFPPDQAGFRNRFNLLAHLLDGH
jgi:hypothetical protein